MVKQKNTGGWKQNSQAEQCTSWELSSQNTEKAIRRIAEPLMNKHWKNSVTNLHRIYRIAEYLLKRQKRK